MIINIIIGVVFLGGLGWLLSRAVRKPPTPGELIRKKREARAQEQARVAAAMARLGEFSGERLEAVAAAVLDMRAALGDNGAFTLNRFPDALEIHFPDAALRIEHQVREVNLDRDHLSDAYLESLEQFSLDNGGRTSEVFQTREALLERLASLIVEYADSARK